MIAKPGYPLLCVPLVDFVDAVDTTQGWTLARIPHEPSKHLRVNMQMVSAPGYPFSGRDTIHRHAVLIVQIAIHAQDPRIIDESTDHIIDAHELHDIAITPIGHVYYRLRPQHRCPRRV